jgi:mono/diheme cytochrome c family protein
MALFSIAGTLAACAPALPYATGEDVRIARSRWPEVSTRDLEAGRALYVQHCAGCHTLKLPDSLAPDHWEPEVSRMRETEGVRMSDREAALVVRYLVSVSTRLRGAGG